MIKLILSLKLLKRLGFIKSHSYSRSSWGSAFVNFSIFLSEFMLVSLGFMLIENHQLALNSEPTHNYVDALWFSAVTISTVGYGDMYPVSEVGRLFVIVFLIIYMPARVVFTFSKIGATWLNNKELKKIGRYFKMLNNHIIVYCDAKTISRNNYMWLGLFVKQNRLSTKFRDSHILIVNGNQDCNESINAHFKEMGQEYKKVSFINANLNENHFFEKTCISQASKVYVLADENDINSDSDVFDVVYRIEKETDYNNGVTAELVNDSNRERLKMFGAKAILRPNRSMPELLVTATIAPGSSEMIEEISSRGNDSIERFSVNPDARFLWGELMYELSMNGVGTISAVVYQNGTVDPNPEGKTVIHSADGILIMVHAMNEKSYSSIQHQIDASVEKVSTNKLAKVA